MRNRPGRIFYAIDFSGLDVDFIREYCEDNLKNKDHIDSVCKASFMFSQFNFDMLKALVEEMNRYGENAHEAMALLNTKPQNSDYTTYDVAVEIDGVALRPEEYNPKSWTGNPMSKPFVVSLYKKEMKTSHNNNLRKVARLRRDDDDNYDDDVVSHFNEMSKNNVAFQPEEHLVSVSPKDGSFAFQNGNVRVVMNRKEYGDENYYSRLF
jgi:hypothetical protein